MSGYFQDPESTRAVPFGGRLARSGDIGYRVGQSLS
jgi:hypothetical protein